MRDTLAGLVAYPLLALGWFLEWLLRDDTDPEDELEISRPEGRVYVRVGSQVDHR